MHPRPVLGVVRASSRSRRRSWPPTWYSRKSCSRAARIAVVRVDAAFRARPAAALLLELGPLLRDSASIDVQRAGTSLFVRRVVVDERVVLGVLADLIKKIRLRRSARGGRACRRGSSRSARRRRAGPRCFASCASAICSERNRRVSGIVLQLRGVLMPPFEPRVSSICSTAVSRAMAADGAGDLGVCATAWLAAARAAGTPRSAAAAGSDCGRSGLPGLRARRQPARPMLTITNVRMTRNGGMGPHAPPVEQDPSQGPRPGRLEEDRLRPGQDRLVDLQTEPQRVPHPGKDLHRDQVAAGETDAEGRWRRSADRRRAGAALEPLIACRPA